ncbi:MAG: helix-turn-helix transcriptional regulator [Pseudomonadota bacterium]
MSQRKTRILAARLREKMYEKDLSQSDLARMLWGETVNSDGYTSAKNRDRISVWLNARAFPSDKNLRMLAEALETTPDDLVPDDDTEYLTSGSVAKLHVLKDDPNTARLQLDRVLPLKAAIRIMDLLNSDEQTETDTTADNAN